MAGRADPGLVSAAAIFTHGTSAAFTVGVLAALAVIAVTVFVAGRGRDA